jgi:hypothetical protein
VRSKDAGRTDASNKLDQPLLQCEQVVGVQQPGEQCAHRLAERTARGPLQLRLHQGRLHVDLLARGEHAHRSLQCTGQLLAQRVRHELAQLVGSAGTQLQRSQGLQRAIEPFDLAHVVGDRHEFGEVLGGRAQLAVRVLRDRRLAVGARLQFTGAAHQRHARDPARACVELASHGLHHDVGELARQSLLHLLLERVETMPGTGQQHRPDLVVLQPLRGGEQGERLAPVPLRVDGLAAVRARAELRVGIELQQRAREVAPPRVELEGSRRERDGPGGE